jgi:glycosyltransferase involved in cell wall biosynthesis
LNTNRENFRDVRIAYLTNQYPKVSHSFIRREIEALERLGVDVARYALRGWDNELVDPQDVEERSRTRYVLRGGALALGWALLKVAVARPVALARAVSRATGLGWRSERGVLRHLVYLAEACVLLHWCRAGGIGHLHAHFGTNPAAVALLLRGLGGPSFSFTVHGPEEFDSPLALSLREKIHQAAFVVAVSSYGRSQLYRWVDYAHWNKIRVVHCGLDKAFHADLAQEVAARPRLVCVGRLCEQKGQFLLLEAVARLASEGVPVELVLAGDGELRGDLERLIEAQGMAGFVNITGWVDSKRVRDEILSARVLVLPSFAEGLPVVIMEAMALGRPVVSTYVAGIPELVIPGETGWLVPAGDADALAEVLREALEADAASLAEMGKRGRERVLQRHDADQEASKLRNIFGDLLHA